LNKKISIEKMQRIALHFYLGYQKQPWFGRPGSEKQGISA
jgi:hypothetical protein